MTLFGVFFILLAAGVLLVYWPALSSSFHLDDFDTIVNTNLPFISPWKLLQQYPTRWLVFLTFYANAHLGGMDVTGFHLVNLGIHLVTSFAIFLLTYVLSLHCLRRYKKSTFFSPVWLSIAAALVFALHPLKSQTVIYITQRFMLCATLWYVLVLLSIAAGCLPGKSRRTGMLFAAIFFVCGLFSKEIIVTAPVLSVVMVWIFVYPPKLYNWKKTHWAGATAVMLAMLLIPVLLFLHLCHWNPVEIKQALVSVGGPLDAHVQGLTRYTYFLTQPSVLLRYCTLFFWPAGLNIDHDILLCRHWYSPQFLVPVSIFILLLWTAWRLRHTTPYILWGLLVFIITLLPQSSIIPTPDLMFEHRAYLAIAGLTWAVFGVCNELMRFFRSTWLTYGIICLWIVLIPVLALLSHQRALVWKNELTLWADAYAKSPDKQRVVINYSNALLGEGKHETVIPLLTAKLAQWPEALPEAYAALGNAYVSSGDMYNAISNYIIAIRHNSMNPVTRYNTALAYFALGQSTRAVQYLDSIITRMPDYADAYFFKGFILSQNPKQKEQAREALNKYLELVPEGIDADTARELLLQLEP